MKNSKVLTFIKNFGYALGSNVTSLLVSTILVLILPKVIGVEEYGYWQIYIFYLSYVGFFHFGWNDGIYLRYAGKSYEELDKKLFYSQFWMLLVFQIFVAITIFIISSFTFGDQNKVFIFYMIAISCLLVIPRALLEYILQFTNRIQEYSKILLLDRILYCVLMLLAVFIGVKNFKYLILLDLIAKSVSFIYAICQCKDIVIRSKQDFSWDFQEVFRNVNVGIKLMFANVASMLIIGIVRICIENTWNVETFGKISLTISISNMMITLVSALGMVIFPIIRRMNIDRMKSIYLSLRNMLVFPFLGILVVYFPIRYFMSMWLPQYEEGLKFMAILFPICIYEGKMSLLINTYLKALRKEKMMLVVNLLSVCLSSICSLLFIVIKKDLFLGVCSILIAISFRAIVAELLLARVLEIKVLKNIALEILMTITFVTCGYSMNNWIGMFTYFICYCLYLIVQKKEIYSLKTYIKDLLRAET